MPHQVHRKHVQLLFAMLNLTAQLSSVDRWALVPLIKYICCATADHVNHSIGSDKLFLSVPVNSNHMDFRLDPGHRRGMKMKLTSETPCSLSTLLHLTKNRITSCQGIHGIVGLVLPGHGEPCAIPKAKSMNGSSCSDDCVQ